MSSQKNGIVSTARIQFLRRTRDRKSLALTIMLPVILMAFLGMLFNSGSAISIRVVVVDQDATFLSGTIANGLGSLDGMTVIEGDDIDSAKSMLRRGMADIIFVIPEGLEKKWVNLTGDANSTDVIRFDVYYRGGEIERNEMLEIALLGMEARVNQFLKSAEPGPVQIESNPLADTKWALPHLFVPLGVMLVLVYSSIYSTSSTAAFLQESRSAELLRCTPLKPSTLAIGAVLTDGALSTVSCLVAVVSGAIIFTLDVSVVEILAAALILLVGSYVLSLLGFLIGSYSQTQGAAQAMAALVGYSMAFFSASFIFPTSMPKTLQTLSHFLPLSQTTNALRLVLLNYPNPMDVLAPMLGLVVWGIVLSLLVGFCNRTR